MENQAAIVESIICPRCGREDTYVLREREQVVSVGNDTVKVPVTVEECSYCGEWLLDDEAAQRVYDAAEKLRQGAIGLTPTGVSYRYP
ncbi:MAG TPA: hypothetical protein VH590_21760 [Ktedonobacterales bacterium]